ncbi:MAG: TIGR03617 family F420-dependent LLM class oxidoreductase [Acidimicrobiia bacterium]
MKVDFYAPPLGPQDVARLASVARDVGFDGFLVSETSHDPFVSLGAAAQVSGALDLGTAIAVAFARSPMVTAMAAWDLAASTSFMLGLGTQVSAHIRGRFSAEWSEPIERMRDYVASVRDIWDVWQHGGRMNHRGRFYRFTLMTPFFSPGPIRDPNVPVWLAGVGPRSLALAAEIADGFHVHPFHTVQYLDDVVLPALRDRPQVASSVLVATGNSSREIQDATRLVRSQIAFYASTPAYRRVLELHGWDMGPALTSLSKRGEWDSMTELVTDEMVDAVAVVAPVDELGGRLRERYRGRLDRIGVYPAVSLPRNDWSRIIDAIRG